MAIISTIVGAIVGLVIELASPWSEVIMQHFNDVLATPSMGNYPELSSMIYAFGIFAAYLFLPCVGAAVGFGIGSKG